MRFIPPLALILINALVLLFVMRERDRSRAGLFVVINAVALLLYAAGQIFYEATDRDPVGLLLPAFASLLVPGNYLLFAVTHPRPVSRFWGRRIVPLVAFLPAMGLMAFTDYRTFPQHLLGYRLDIGADLRDRAWLFGTYVYFLTWLMIALWVFFQRYRESSQGSVRDLAKHMVAAISGALMFAAFFWTVTREGSTGVAPSPTLLGALLAQIGIFIAIRQGEFERPMLLGRSLYFTLAGVTAFLVVSFLFQLYEVLALRPLVETQSQGFTAAVAVLLVLLLATFPTPQAWFDRVFFRRAWEYRKLVIDAQRELRETQDRLRRAERLSTVGEVAARIAHEIKNPLGPIKGYTQMLKEKIERLENLPQRDQMLSHLEVIAEEVTAIDRKVHSLLDIARRPLPERHVLDANALAERTATLLRLEVAATPGGRRHVDIISDLAPGLPEFTGDRTRLEEALFNLGRNALDAVGAEGRIVVSTRGTDADDGAQGIVFLIRDDGPGLSAEAAQKVFTPFFTEKAGGTGLGLTIAQTHAQEHGGTLSLRNHASGGAEARLWVPLEPPATDEGSPGAIPNVRGPLPGEVARG